MNFWGSEKKRILDVSKEVFKLHTELYPSQVDKYSNEAFERYVLDSTTKWLTNNLVFDINLALEIAVKEFDLHKNIEGICALKQYAKYILDNWEIYANKEFTLYGFLCSWGNLSLVPFDMGHAKTEYIKKNRKTFKNEYLTYSYEEEENIEIECTSLIIPCEIIRNERKESKCVEVTGKLTKDKFDYYKNFMVIDCSVKPCSYSHYRSTLEDHLLVLNDEMIIQKVSPDIIKQCESFGDSEELFKFLENERSNYDISVEEYLALNRKYSK